MCCICEHVNRQAQSVPTSAQARSLYNDLMKWEDKETPKPGIHLKCFRFTRYQMGLLLHNIPLPSQNAQDARSRLPKARPKVTSSKREDIRMILKEFPYTVTDYDKMTGRKSALRVPWSSANFAVSVQ